MQISRNMVDRYCGFDWREVISLLVIVLVFCIMVVLAWMMVLAENTLIDTDGHGHHVRAGPEQSERQIRMERIKKN